MASILKHGDSMGFVVPQELKNMAHMVKTMSNPQAAIAQLSKQNPALQQVMDMCNGRDPQQVFYDMCKQRGIDPNTILNQLQ